MSFSTKKNMMWIDRNPRWHNWHGPVLALARELKPRTFLNVGHGFGTQLLLEEPSIRSITTLETDPKWFKKLPANGDPRHELICTAPEGEAHWIMESDHRTWDMSLVDGMNGQRMSCLAFLMYLGKSPIIACHDAETESMGYRWIAKPDTYERFTVRPDDGSNTWTEFYVYEKLADRVRAILEKGRDDRQ